MPTDEPPAPPSAKQAYTKFRTDCQREHQASLACITDNYGNRDVCQPFFDNYKECRKEEQKRRLEENAKRSSFW